MKSASGLALAEAIALAIRSAANTVLKQRNVPGVEGELLASLAREIGNNAGQNVLMVLEEHERTGTVDPEDWGLADDHA